MPLFRRISGRHEQRLNKLTIIVREFLLVQLLLHRTHVHFTLRRLLLSCGERGRGRFQSSVDPEKNDMQLLVHECGRRGGKYISIHPRDDWGNRIIQDGKFSGIYLKSKKKKNELSRDEMFLVMGCGLKSKHVRRMERSGETGLTRTGWKCWFRFSHIVSAPWKCGRMGGWMDKWIKKSRRGWLDGGTETDVGKWGDHHPLSDHSTLSISIPRNWTQQQNIIGGIL